MCAEEIKDTIMRELFYHKKEPFVEQYKIPQIDECLNIDEIIEELETLNYLRVLEYSRFKITHCGEDFCLSSSFCFPEKPLIIQLS